MKLPTKDAYLKAFRDALSQGKPLAKCIESGIMIKGEPHYGYTYDHSVTFRKTMKDRLGKGMTVDKAIRDAVRACK